MRLAQFAQWEERWENMFEIATLALMVLGLAFLLHLSTLGGGVEYVGYAEEEESVAEATPTPVPATKEIEEAGVVEEPESPRTAELGAAI